jgi:hypothetical protein
MAANIVIIVAMENVDNTSRSLSFWAKVGLLVREAAQSTASIASALLFIQIHRTPLVFGLGACSSVKTMENRQ